MPTRGEQASSVNASNPSSTTSLESEAPVTIPMIRTLEHRFPAIHRPGPLPPAGRRCPGRQLGNGQRSHPTARRVASEGGQETTRIDLTNHRPTSRGTGTPTIRNRPKAPITVNRRTTTRMTTRRVLDARTTNQLVRVMVGCTSVPVLAETGSQSPIESTTRPMRGPPIVNGPSLPMSAGGLEPSLAVRLD